MVSEARPVPPASVPPVRSGRGMPRRMAVRRLAAIALGLGALALLIAVLRARLLFPSDRTPEGAYLRIVIAVNRGRAQDFFAYTETRAQHACYTIRAHR